MYLSQVTDAKPIYTDLDLERRECDLERDLLCDLDRRDRDLVRRLDLDLDLNTENITTINTYIMEMFCYIN